MSYFKPTKYYKNIYFINFSKLKEEGVKCLIFDLDNTLGMAEHETCPEESKKLLKELQKDFSVYICSNNTRKRISPYLEELGVEGTSWSLKPLTRGLRIIKNKNHFQKKEMVMIGDQIVTDVLAGKRFGIKTILVDPLGEKDLKITGLNRKIEKQIVKYYQKKGVFERGKYYE